MSLPARNGLSYDNLQSLWKHVSASHTLMERWCMQSLTLNLEDGREVLNSLLVAGPDRVSKMRGEIALARDKLMQAQQHPPPGGLAWLRDGLAQGTEELVNMFARNANRPAGV